MISSSNANTQREDWAVELRECIVALKTALDVGNKDLARYSIKKIVNIISKVSYVYDLWE